MQLPTQALLLLLLFRIRQHGEPTDAVATRGEMTEAHESQPARDIAIGALWLAGGVAVTLLSMSGAKSGGGGRYVVTIGPIAYGLVRMVRGLARLGR